MNVNATLNDFFRLIVLLFSGASLWYLGHTHFGSFATEYGYHLNIFGSREGAFYFLYLVFGAVSVLALSGLSFLPRFTDLLVEGLEENRSIFLILLLFVLVALIIRNFALVGAPMTDDENAYLFASEILLDYKLYFTASDLVGSLDLYRNQFVAEYGGKVFTQYYPGFPFVLAIAKKVGLVYLLNPLLSALTLLGVYRLSGLLYNDSRISAIAVVLLAASPSFLISAALLMSHPFACCLVVWGAYCVIKGDRESSLLIGTLGISMVGLLLFTRPLTAICFSACLLLYFFYLRGSLRGFGKHLFVGIFLGAAFSLLFLTYNFVLTGDPFITSYAAFDENVAGSSVSFAGDSLFNAYQLETITIPLLRYNFWLLAWPVSFLLLYFVDFTRENVFCLMCFSLVTFIYSFWPSVGVNLAGAFHYIEFIPFLVLPIAAVISNAYENKLNCLTNVATASTIVGLTMFYPWAYFNLRNLALENVAPVVFVEEHVPSNSIVFVDGLFNFGNTWTYYRPYTDPDYQDSILWFTYVNELESKSVCSTLQRNCFIYRMSLENSLKNILLKSL